LEKGNRAHLRGQDQGTVLLPFDRRRTRSTFETQVPEDLVDDEGIIEEGDNGTSPTTTRTLQHVFLEDPLHQV